MKVILDFETANTAGVDLPTVGAEAYAQHPATEVLCLCMKCGDKALTWKPGDHIADLHSLASHPDVEFEAHNSAFEQMVWAHIMVPRYGLPHIPIRRWSCSMAKALAKGMPGGLDNLAKVLQLDEQKDNEGSALTKSLSKPITKKAWATEWKPADWSGSHKEWLAGYKPIYDRRPATIESVERYCMQDCTVEYHAGEAVGELSPYERAVWEHDQVINHRGVKIDVPFVEAAIDVLQQSKAGILADFNRLTGGLEPGQIEQVRQWCGRQGVDLPDMTAPRIDALLGQEEDVEDGVVQRGRKLPPHVHEVLSLRRLLGAASITKFPRMLQCLGADQRVRWLLQYHGAGTGRWAGRLFQPHNFIKLSVPDPSDPDHALDPETVVALFMSRDPSFVEFATGLHPVKAGSRALRHALVAEHGCVYNTADFAGIEMRIVLALAGAHKLVQLLASGQSPYITTAEDIFGRKIDKHADVMEYTIGKNTILGCGFQMGGETFHERYCPHLRRSFADKVVWTYRNKTAPEVPDLWTGLENAALNAVATGHEHSAYGIIYRLSTCRNWLMCMLPDGQTMWYRQPELCEGRFGNPAWRYRAWKDGRWQSIDAYGGLLTENAVQKLARGLLVEAMRRLEAHGFPIILTIHDEIVAETPNGGPRQTEFEQIMAEAPAWAKAIGVPIAVEGWTGGRYRK